jgi:amidohydrolase
MYPEVGFELEGTACFIETYLNDIGIKTERIAGMGIIGYIAGKDKTKPVLALRSDMDACPLQEETNLDFKSKNRGFMHACGHDAHMAILLTLAKYLSEVNYVPEGSIKLIFQPAEEIGTGAKTLIAEGVLEDVEAIIGYHLWPEWESGIIQAKDGAQMAGSDKFKITLTGRGGHGAYPFKALNPINGAAEICSGINMIPGRVLKTLEYASLSIGKIKSGTIFNVIPEVAVIEGSLRTLAFENRQLILEEIKNITENIAKAYRLKSDLNFRQIAPILMNDSGLAELIRKAAQEAGQKLVKTNRPVMVSEDFAFYLQERPGTLFLIGAGQKEANTFLHNPQFDLDENAMQNAILTLAEIIKGYWLEVKGGFNHEHRTI